MYILVSAFGLSHTCADMHVYVPVFGSSLCRSVRAGRGVWDDDLVYDIPRGGGAPAGRSRQSPPNFSPSTDRRLVVARELPHSGVQERSTRGLTSDVRPPGTKTGGAAGDVAKGYNHLVNLQDDYTPLFWAVGISQIPTPGTKMGCLWARAPPPPPHESVREFLRRITPPDDPVSPSIVHHGLPPREWRDMPHRQTTEWLLGGR